MARALQNAAGGTLQVSAVGSNSPPAEAAGSGSGGSGGRKHRQTGFDRLPGRRPLKEYPITEGELTALATIGAVATLCFSVASALFGFAVTVTKDIAFASTLPDSILTFWGTLRIGAFIGTGIFVLFGIVFIVVGKSKISAIKRETTHG